MKELRSLSLLSLLSLLSPLRGETLRENVDLSLLLEKACLMGESLSISLMLVLVMSLKVTLVMMDYL